MRHLGRHNFPAVVVDVAVAVVVVVAAAAAVADVFPISSSGNCENYSIKKWAPRYFQKNPLRLRLLPISLS